MSRRGRRRAISGQRAGLDDVDRRRSHIDAFGSKRCELAVAQAGVGTDENERAVRPGDGGGEAFDLGRLEEPRLLVGDLWQRQSPGGVVFDEPGPDGDVETLGEQASGLAHGSGRQLGGGQSSDETLGVAKADLIDGYVTEAWFEMATEDRFVAQARRRSDADPGGDEFGPPLAKGRRWRWCRAALRRVHVGC